MSMDAKKMVTMLEQSGFTCVRKDGGTGIIAMKSGEECVHGTIMSSPSGGTTVTIHLRENLETVFTQRPDISTTPDRPIVPMRG